MNINILCSQLVFLSMVIFFKCWIKAEEVYKPTWDSLDQRPLPDWYNKAKLGIFIHWGVFSVPSFKTEWFWWNWKGKNQTEFVEFMNKNYPPKFAYADFAPQFTAEFFDPNEWADLFKSSGAKYVVLTSKHHEGFTNWPSKTSWNWNSNDVGPHRDLVGDLAAAIRQRTDIHFGLYHSLFEWFNPMYLSDKKNGFTTNEFVVGKTFPELVDIVNQYKPDVIWSDGDWEAKDTYWNSTGFLAWLYNNSPVKDTVVTNDRWGQGCAKKHGGFYSGSDRFNPGVLLKHKWENCMTIDKHSWGFRRNAKLNEYETIEELLQTFVETVSCGGNMLMNIGPTKEGTIVPIFQERLSQFGEWLEISGEGIYESQPWVHQNDTVTPGVWYTTNKGYIYCFFFKWPTTGSIVLGAFKSTPISLIYVLGYGGSDVKWSSSSSGLTVDLSEVNFAKVNLKHLWVLKIQPRK